MKFLKTILFHNLEEICIWILDAQTDEFSKFKEIIFKVVCGTKMPLAKKTPNYFKKIIATRSTQCMDP